MNERRTIVVLLTVIAAALVMNVVVVASRTAKAQPTASAGEPYVVTLLPIRLDRYYRVWSDGRVDDIERPFGSCDFTLQQEVSYGPVEHPFPVVAAVLGARPPLSQYHEQIAETDGSVVVEVLGATLTVTPACKDPEDVAEVNCATEVKIYVAHRLARVSVRT